jgi:predicted peptidase
MRRLACALVAVAVVVLGGEARAEERTLTGIAGGYPALLFLPAHYDEQPRWPLLLYLHGAVERGDDLERAGATGPPKEIRADRVLPAIVVAPLLPAEQRWEPERLRAVLDAVVARERVDPDRVYATGKSLGGFGVWALAAAYPRRFAALVPVAAAGDPNTVCTLAAVPVWAFHNRDDPVVAVSRDEASIAAFERCGGKARLTVLPAGGHDAWTAAYAKPELYEWLLAQRRAAEP